MTPGPEYKVKPLVWDHSNAAGVDGRYYVFVDHAGYSAMFFRRDLVITPDFMDLGFKATLEASRALCQAHYDAAVRELFEGDK